MLLSFEVMFSLRVSFGLVELLIFMFQLIQGWIYVGLGVLLICFVVICVEFGVSGCS